MVRVFKCHRFASQQVIPLSREPLTICADDDKVFVATSDCEIIVFQIEGGSFKEIHRCPTISQVDLIVYNSFKSYIVTVELKKSWKRETKSVHVYLNWQINIKNGGKPRTKVSVAGKSHVQHASSPSAKEVMEIIEVPMDKNATCAAVCKYTGNFAIACNSEVKLCSVVEKTVANSDKNYLDVEIFLELCWNFPVKSITMCEEFIVCCSHKEVQGIRVRYDEGDKISVRAHRKFLASPSTSIGSGGRSISAPTLDHDSSRRSSGAATPQSYVSETYLFNDQQRADRVVSFSPLSDLENSEMGCLLRDESGSHTLGKDFSTVGMKPGGRVSPKAIIQSLVDITESKIIDDEDFVEWSFQHGGGAAGSAAVCLPGLHTNITQSQCHHHAQMISPPVLSDILGGKVKSSSGVQAETVLHLCDTREKEDWMSVVLVPTFHGGLSTPLRVSSINTDRMRSAVNTNRTSMCCYISGNRGGYLYQLSPLLTQISSYKYTDLASQVGLSQSHLHIVTTTGIETYTSRWGIVSLEMGEKEEDDQDCYEQIYPSSSLDICLCGHEPFFSAVNLSVGRDFLALLSKVKDPKGKEEAHWGLYILNMLSLLDMYKEMIIFAQGIRTTGPASYIHLLQEAHLLLSTHPLCTACKDTHVKQCLREVSRMLGDFYAQPRQEDWCLSSPFYKSSRVSVKDVVTEAVDQAEKLGVREFGKGLIDYLDGILFAQDEFVSLNSTTCDTILNIYAVAAPHKLSKVILLSNNRAYSTEAAYHHLKTWLAVKASASQPISATDKLAMVQLHLLSCDVEHACSQLMSIHKPSLVDICSSHPSLIRENLSTLTSLAQMMRQHMSNTLLEILVEMLDRCVMSLDSLLILLNSQSDHPYNNHTREVLEMILTDSKRIFLFEEAVHLLCDVYIARLKNKDQPPLRQVIAVGHQKFFLPQGDGHFSPRFAWLDYLPPFYDPEKISKPCVRLEIKHIPGQTLWTNSLPITLSTKQITSEPCHCCTCNESLLKLQSLLCSPRLTTDLAAFVLNQLELHGDEDRELSPKLDDKYLDSIKLLCLTKLDLEKATEQIVDCYPNIASSFAVCCFKASIEKFTFMLRYMESNMKKCHQTPGDPMEENYVKSYKDLLSRLTEIFSPAQFLDLLPTDGNLFFLLPFLCSSLKLAHTSKLKRKITDMGRELMTQS